MIRDAVIFQAVVPPDQKLNHWVSEWGLYIENLRRPALNRTKKVASASLFFYPDRSRKGDIEGYRIRTTVFLTGILQSLEYVRAIKDWTFRLYVDYSIVRAAEHSDDPDLQQIASKILSVLDDYAMNYKKELEIICVRSSHANYKVHTFLPSLWRYLPLFDPDVEMLLCSDADNPFNSLYIHFAKSHWEHDARYFMIVPDSYAPHQCLIHAAMNMESQSALLCLNAQLWGAKKTDNQNTIENPRVFTRMLEVLRHSDTHALWSSLDDLSEMRIDVVKAIGTSTHYKELLYVSGWEPLKDMLIRVTQAISRDLSKKCKRANLTRLLEIASTNREIAGFIAFMSFPNLIERHFAPARWLAHSDFRDLVIPAVLDQSFGLDEWLLHILYDHAVLTSKVSLLRTSSHDKGLTFRDVVNIQRDDPGNTARILSDVAGNYWPPFGDFTARCVAFLKMIAPEANDRVVGPVFKQLKSNYYKRLYLIARVTFEAMGMDFNAVYKIFDSLYWSEGFEKRSQKHLMNVSDSKKFENWIKVIGVKFDHKTRRFTYPSVKAFIEVKEVCLKGCLVDIKLLHCFKFSEDLAAQLVPW